MNQQFSIDRFASLLRADLMLRTRTVLIVSAAFAGLILIHGTLTTFLGDPGRNIYPFWFYGMLFLWGAIAASYSFPELHDKSRNQAYLLMPASALEKTLSRLVIATVLFWPFLTVLLVVTSWLNAGIGIVFFGESLPLFSPGAFVSWPLLGHALVSQSIYFLGAAWFRRAHFVKTVFASTLIVNGLSIVAGLIVWVLYRDTLGAMGPGGLSEAEIIASHQQLFEIVTDIGPAIYFFILPPFCWWVAWLRVRETQVSYGV